jgi:hypothetical protein
MREKATSGPFGVLSYATPRNHPSGSWEGSIVSDFPLGLSALYSAASGTVCGAAEERPQPWPV